MNKVILSLLFMAISACIPVYEYVVEYDYSYAGNFKKYRSFDFMKNPYTGGTEAYNAIIEKAITERMGAQGYRYYDKKPSLLITYKIFYDDFYLNGYNQPNLEIWIKNVYSKNYLTVSDIDITDSTQFVDNGFSEEEDEDVLELRKVKDRYDPIKCALREGTIFISFLDRRSERVVWQGYGSGIFGNKNFNNEKFLQITVRKILDKYRILARGFNSQLRQ